MASPPSCWPPARRRGSGRDGRSSCFAIKGARCCVTASSRRWRRPAGRSSSSWAPRSNAAGVSWTGLEAGEVHVAINPAWADGMGSSIRAGMTALTAAAPDARAVVIMLCDQPLVTAAFIDRLARRYVAEAESVAERQARAERGTREPRSRRGAERRRRQSRRLLPNMTVGPACRLCSRARDSRSCRVWMAPPARVACFAGAAASSSASVNTSGAAREAASSHVVTLPCPEAAVDVDTITDYEALPQ